MSIIQWFIMGIILAAELALIYPFVKSMIPQKTNRSLALKMVCSTAFLSLGVLARIFTNTDSIYSLVIIIALCLAWLGDFLLGLNGSKVYFVVGGFFFLLTHFCFITAFTYQSQTDAKKEVLGIFEILFSAALLVAFEIYNRSKKISLGKLHIPVLIYGLILTIMLAKSFLFSMTLFESGNFSAAVLVLLGAILFFVSDFTLTYTILEEKRKTDVKYKFINSLSYFLGQSLIALSIIAVK